MIKKKLQATLQKDYYGKAYTLEHEDGTIELLSYATIVCGYYLDANTGALEFRKNWNGYSRTTMNHINDFRLLLGDNKLCKKEWDAIPCNNTKKYKVMFSNGFVKFISRVVFDSIDDAYSFGDEVCSKRDWCINYGIMQS